jgi:hypothetical protein
LLNGETKAFANVAADVALTAATIGGSVLVGAVATVLAPVAAGVVGVAASLAFGIAATYGIQTSGLRDAVAHRLSDWGQRIKNLW